MRIKATRNAEPDTRSLVRVDDRSELPQGMSYRQLFYLSKDAAAVLNSAMKDGSTQPLYVFVDAYEILVSVYPGRETVFKVVVPGESGNPTFLAEKRRMPAEVSTLLEGQKAAMRLNKKLIGATLLFNTEFFEQHERVHLEIGSGDARKLGIEEFREGYYRVAMDGTAARGSERAVASAKRN